MKILKITIAALLVLGVAALAGVGRPEAAGGAAADELQRGITVTGSGEARRTPDRAYLSFGVLTHGATAAETQAAHVPKVKRLIAALKEAGVAERDLKTEQFDVSPRYDVDKVPRPQGYTASSSVSVSNQTLERASRLSELGVAAGADNVSGPGLSSADPDAGYDKALAGAVADARKKAEALAEAAGVQLGDVVSIVEGGGVTPMPMYAEARALDAKMPIEPGTEEISAAVTVTFAIS